MFDISVFSQNVNNASCFPIEVTPRHFNKKKKIMYLPTDYFLFISFL